MKIPKACVVCGTKELDTSMVVKIDDKQYEVWVCKEHEDISLKQAKEKLLSILDEFESLKKKIEEYGYLVISKDDKQQARQNQSGNQNMSSPKVNPEPVPVPVQVPRSAAGNVGDINVEEHTPYNVNTAAKVQNVKLKNGNEVAIPLSNDDIPEIRIVSGINDAILQANTQNLAKKSNLPGFKGSKYGTDCPACRGAGINKVSKSECKKCGGTGILT